MKPRQHRRAGGNATDQQREMFGAALGRAEGDDLGIGRAVERQTRAGDDPQPVGAGVGEDGVGGHGEGGAL
jgi:hypothetical protein